MKAHDHGVEILRETVIGESKNPFNKHVDILASAACCIRMMKGGRGTNCKSTKIGRNVNDLEHSRLTYYNHIKSRAIRDDKTTKQLTEDSVFWMANGQRVRYSIQ